MSQLTHTDSAGNARMVNVGDKLVTRRVATAGARIQMAGETLALIRDNQVAKGDVIAVARIAGIQAAKRCDSLIPLCHSLPLDDVQLDFTMDDSNPSVLITATAQVESKTGVEMEALTAVTVAALTIYDMCKAADRGMEIADVRLLRKEGGRSGVWERDEGEASE